MTTKELKSYIDRILGNSVRLLLPSYWWKRAFGAVIDKVDEKVEKSELKTVNGESILGEGDLKIGVKSVGSVEELNALEAKNGGIATVVSEVEAQTVKYADCYVSDDTANYASEWNKFTIIKRVEEAKPLSSSTAAYLCGSTEAFTKDLIVIAVNDTGYAYGKYTDSSLTEISLNEVNDYLAKGEYRLVIGWVVDECFVLYTKVAQSAADAYIKADSWKRLLKEGDVTGGGLQYALERTAYVTKTKMGNNVNDIEITEEQRAYNIETIRLACIEDKAVIISREGVIFSAVFKSNVGDNFTLSANIGNLLSCTLYMRKNGDAEIEISNAVDTKLDLDSTNPVQNKVVADKLLRLNEILLHYDDSGLDSDRKCYNVNYLNFLGHDATARLMCIYNSSDLMPITSYKSDNNGGIYAYVMVNGTDDTSSQQIKVHFKADGSAEKIGEVAGGALSAPERIVYFENPNTTAKLTDEQKAYNAETYKRVQIDDLPVFFSWHGHWGYQKEGTFGDPNGYMIIGFLIGDKELSVKITADGSGSQIAISNVVDSELSDTSENPLQNKVVTEALNDKVDKSYVDNAIANAITTTLNTAV